MEPSDQLLIEFEEQERWRDLLGEVLAVLNRDGGHYQTKHGAGRAAIEGIRSHYQMLATIGALQAENARLRDALNEACDWLKRLQEEYDPTDTEDGIADIERLRGGVRMTRALGQIDDATAEVGLWPKEFSE